MSSERLYTEAEVKEQIALQLQNFVDAVSDTINTEVMPIAQVMDPKDALQKTLAIFNGTAKEMGRRLRAE